MFRKIALATLALTSVIAGAQPATTSAGAATSQEAGRWTKVGKVATNFAQPGLARTTDQVLHAVWVRKNPGDDNASDIMHTGFGSGGSIAQPTSVIQSGWNIIWPVPDVVELGTDSHLVALFGGMRSTDPNETHLGISAATAPTDASAWTLSAGEVAGSQGGSDQIGATTVGDVPFFSWGHAGGIYVHRGTDPSTPDYDYQAALGGCCGYNPDMAVSQTGRIWLTWYSNSSQNGVWAQEVDAGTGAPVGSPTKMPGSTTRYSGEDESIQQITRTPIAAQEGTGSNVYVAYTGGYPFPNRLRVWTIGPDGPSADSNVVASVGAAKSIGTPAVATDPSGRTWVLWTESNGGSVKIYARRSNVGATRWGATVSVKAPNPDASCQSITELTPEGTAGGVVDVFATVVEGCGPSYALWHTQMEPGLSLGANPSRFQGKQKITFKVSDAGVAVRGAKVSIDGKSAVTDEDGIARIVLGPYSRDKKLVASATKNGYIRAHTVVRANGGN